MPGAVWADNFTYDFTGTLSSSFSGTNVISGQFTIDFSADPISALSFTAPFGTVKSTNYTPFGFDIGGFLGLDFQGPDPEADELILRFQTPTPFTTASLYTGIPPGLVQISVPLEVSGGSVANCLDSLSSETCTTTTGASDFLSGTATPVSTPEPSALAQLAIALIAPLVFVTARSCFAGTRSSY